MKKIFGLFICAAMLALLASCVRVEVAPAAGKVPEISIIPRPERIEPLPGAFLLSPGTKILVPAGDDETKHVAEYLAGCLHDGTNLDFEIAEVSSSATNTPPNAFIFNKLNASDLVSEGYRLTAGPGLILLEASAPQGLFYAVQTILQLLPPEIFSVKNIPGVHWTIPAVKITDTPRYSWRGMLLDVSRHFFSKEFIKKFIDYLVLHKMNTFHWHLTDDQGWRIEIKKYPRLTEVGAWRADREDKPWTEREPQKEGEKAANGGFYTQEEIREILAYAKSRFVTIVPEIEMPGHCLAALASYPQVSCTGGPFTVPPGSVWPITNVYCPGSDETFDFLENVLAEVIALFPSPYIHIGGDEVDKANWKKCPKCQARMKAEGLKTEEELQSYFIRRIEKFLNGRGKKLIGWDEILEGGLAPNAAVMSWRGTEGGIAAAREGHDVVMTPTSHCYFDYYQGPPASEPPAIGGYLPLSKVYSFEPTPSELKAGEAAHILGAQANLWTEYIATPEHAEYMIFPRIAAIAEAGWSPQASKNWMHFAARMTAQFERYRLAGIHYAKSAYGVRVSPELETLTKEVVLRLETETFRPDIHFTLDGSDPTPASRFYDRPIHLTKSAILRAGTFLAGELQGNITEKKFFAHKALGKPTKLVFPYKDRYKGGGEIGLTNGLRGSKSHGDGEWQGFEGDDLVAEIDLGRAQKISRLTAGFLQNINSWIFLPASVEFDGSDDGQDYRKLAMLENNVSPKSAAIILKDFSAKIPGVQVRFIRVRAKNIGTCPAGHPGAGRKAWLFADEIIVE